MTNKLRTAIVSLAMVGAAAAAVAQTGELIGGRYAAFDLGYTTWDDGGHIFGPAVALNVPSSIKGLDLGIEAAYGDGGYDDIDLNQVSGGVYGVYYSKLSGFTPYLRVGAGFVRSRVEYLGDSASDSSFTYSIGGGVEVPLAEKVALDLHVAYSDWTSADDGDSITGGLAVNYAISDKMSARVGYARDFDNDSNMVTGGMVFRY